MIKKNKLIKRKKIKQNNLNNYYRISSKSELIIFKTAKITNFDRLKIAIPITTRLSLTYNNSYFDKMAIENQSNLNWEIKKETLFKSHLQVLLGVKEISIKDNSLILDISGKVVAKKDSLGYLNKYTIENALRNINNSTAPISFNINEAISSAYILYCDVNQDIIVDNPQAVLKALKLLLQVCSNRFKIMKYDSGVLVKPIAKSVKDSLCFYYKYQEITKKTSTYLRDEYIEKIGLEYLGKTKNIIRVERHLGSWRDIRKAFNIEVDKKKLKTKILLSTALNTKVPVLSNRLIDFRISVKDLEKRIDNSADKEGNEK